MNFSYSVTLIFTLSTEGRYELIDVRLDSDGRSSSGRDMDISVFTENHVKANNLEHGKLVMISKDTDVIASFRLSYKPLGLAVLSTTWN